MSICLVLTGSWYLPLLIRCYLVSAKHIYGYEVVAQAISDACLNAKLNGIHNATFVQGDLNKIDESFGNNFPKPDIVISGERPCCMAQIF